MCIFSKGIYFPSKLLCRILFFWLTCFCTYLVSKWYTNKQAKQTILPTLENLDTGWMELEEKGRWWCTFGPHVWNSPRNVLKSQLQVLKKKPDFWLPCPKWALLWMAWTPWYPRLLQTTCPARISQRSSQIVPQRPWWKISTLPSWGPVPSTSRTFLRVAVT